MLKLRKEWTGKRNPITTRRRSKNYEEGKEKVDDREYKGDRYFNFVNLKTEVAQSVNT